MAPNPWSFTVTRAFAAGLRASGVAVVDSTQTPFVGTSQANAAPVVVTGEVRTLWTEARLRPGIGDLFSTAYPYAFTAECRVLIQVYTPATTSTAWEREYGKTSSASETYGLRGGSLWDRVAAQSVSRLAAVLAETVEEAVNDPQFVRAIRPRS